MITPHIRAWLWTVYSSEIICAACERKINENELYEFNTLNAGTYLLHVFNIEILCVLSK